MTISRAKLNQRRGKSGKYFSHGAKTTWRLRREKNTRKCGLLSVVYIGYSLDLPLQSCPLCGACTSDAQRLMKDKWDAEEHGTGESCFQGRLQSAAVNR